MQDVAAEQGGPEGRVALGVSAVQTHHGDPGGWLHPLLAGADQVWQRAHALVRAIASDTRLTTTTRLTEVAGMSERSLQRLFARYVGPSPKQVIVRYRLQDAVASLAEPRGETLASLATRLGFYDQAHFAREFTAFVGIPPSQYRAGHPVRP